MKQVTVLVFFIITCYQLSSAQKITGFPSPSANNQLMLEKQFDSSLSAENIGASIKLFSAYPHNLGSAGSKNVADSLLKRFKNFGFDAHIETFTVLFPSPKTRLLEMIAPSTYKALLKEPGLKEDATSGQKDQLPTYNAFSADGNVTAELVYVNYGIPEDYDKLTEMGIDVKGKIVIAKYGHSWRGIKPKVAQEHGAVGCLIYSDPQGDGFYEGEVYPKGAFKSEFGVQRGSVLDMPQYAGDPLTPGVGATDSARRQYTYENAPTILKIPVLPISYHDALPLLKALSGQVVPEGWQGALPITYHTGPGPARVHLQMEFNWDMVKCYDVVATVRGSELPDEWVCRGNHHDAWVNGASDPVSGLAAMMEEAKAIGVLLRRGWRPKRTIKYFAWDGEEQGLLGSTEYTETHAAELQQKTVVYINSDNNGRGFLDAGGSHALEPLMDEIAKSVTDPQTNVSIYERFKAHDVTSASAISDKKTALAKAGLELDALGSGSDYSSFLQHLGIPTLNLGFSGEDAGGEYHSIYDSYDDYSRFKDPGFIYCRVLAQTAGHAVLRMADAIVLPFDYTKTYRAADTYTKQLNDMVSNMRESTLVENQLLKANSYKLASDPTKPFMQPRPKAEVPFIDFSPLQNALVNLKAVTDSLQVQENKQKQDTAFAKNFNAKMYHAEQQLLLPDGLPARGWYKHSLYAPGLYTGYGVKTLPGVREAIEQRSWVQAQQQINMAAASINKLADYLKM